jgi:hypothetical protein
MIYSTAYFLTGNYLEMNSGLPSLLDAIFGKNDLASVSLDEMYEVINEFPSFNAGHFLLAKKLKLEDNEAFEKESMRTALYFNNAFWLETLLNEEDKISNIKNQSYTNENDDNRDQTEVAAEVISELDIAEYVDSEKIYNTHPHIAKEEEIKEVNSPKVTEDVFDSSKTEDTVGIVSSFDELISKYHIESITPVYESAPPSPVEDIPLPSAVLPEEPVNELQTELPAGRSEETPSEQIFDQGETFPQPLIDSDPEEYETREEVLNEYGIFEDVVVKKSDLDLEAFDRPIERISDLSETDTVEATLPVDENITELKQPEEPFEKSVERDYDAFDGRTDDAEPDQHFMESEDNEENLIVSGSLDADDTDRPEGLYVSEQSNWDDQLSNNLNTGHELQKPATSFDPKKAESIVFAPYHMIDYFASQGIKLVLEENPVDNFGKQLKSFTDWLKVMKKIPPMPSSEKADEKESERIRHFAAHSIEERDILTESMAEVLAKQGMFENAIALYQKLSLIYPPKSAYFASRIEQLKASLP